MSRTLNPFHCPRFDAFLDKLRAGMEGKPQEALDKLNRDLDVDVSELSIFQTRKSLAYCQGKLSLEESQQLYAWLGNTPETFNRQPLAVKCLVTQIMHELLSK